jgi:DNA modification methylase
LEQLLFCCDSAEGLDKLNDGSVKLLYGSPPYPLASRDYGEWDESSWLRMMKRHLTAVVPKMHSDGFIVLNVKANREQPSRGRSYRRRVVERLLIWIEDNLPWYPVDDEVWVKTNPATTGLRAAAQDAWEPIYVWSVHFNWDWNLDAIRREYSQETLDTYARTTYRPRENGPSYVSKEKKIDPNPLGALPINVVTGPVAGPSEFKHQARQPEYLPERYIKAYTKRGDLVVDPWMGSGTTLVAAQRMGRNVAGIDYLKDNVEMVRNRLYPQM